MALGYITHDLKAPAATIKGYVELLRASAPSTQACHFDAIHRSSDYQLSLIDELLEFATQELKPLDIRPAELDLKSLIQKLFEQGRALCRQQGNLFMIFAVSPLPAHIHADARRLFQVLLNLIANAASFTKQGKVTLLVSSVREDDHVVLSFSVRDNGPGIAIERQAKIFDAFEQDRPGHGSVGLGLHIARNIVRNMEGDLKLESAPGAGSCFSFHLRVKVCSTETFHPAYESDQEITLPMPDQTGLSAAPRSLWSALDELAQYARMGEISRIEQWLSESFERHPDAVAFLRKIESSAERLDLACIEQLACYDERLPSTD